MGKVVRAVFMILPNPRDRAPAGNDVGAPANLYAGLRS